MNIWIINEYAGSLKHGMTYRHYSLAKELVKAGHQVRIFTSSFSHFTSKEHIKPRQTFTKEDVDGVDFVWVKMPAYKRSTRFGRVRNWFLFALKLFFIPLIKLEKPDCILVSSLPLHPIVPAKFLANKYKAKLIFEVRDIWPLSAMELGGYSPHNIFIKHLQYLEDFAYKNADAVVSVLAYAYEHMKTRGLQKEKFHWIANGISLEEQELAEPLSQSLEMLIPKDKFIVGYTGSLGRANALESLIQAAKLIQGNKEIVFVLVGDGEQKQKLFKLAQGMQNLIFIDSIPKNQVQSMLQLFDVCFIGWYKQTLYNYGIAANKLYDYLYSAKPILHAFSGKGDPVAMAKSGISVQAQNPQAIAKAILDLKDLTKTQREMMGQRGKAYVIQNHSYMKLSQDLLKVCRK